MKISTSLRMVLSMLLLLPLSLVAQIEAGKVYMFSNIMYTGKSMIATADARVAIATTNDADYNQLWYVSQVGSSTYRLRNLGTGLYLNSSKATSGAWTVINEDKLPGNTTMKCSKAGSGYTLRASSDTNDHGYMHSNSSGVVVCWNASAEASQWTLTEVAIDEATLESNWESLKEMNPTADQITAWNAALAALFKDKLCTQLADAYATYTTEQMKEDANYQVLSPTLQKMVLKMTVDGSWAEENAVAGKPAWDAEYAKRLRVQMIEPYCNKESAAQGLGMQAHTNLNNPLGLYANNHQVLYIFVEGEIKTGSTLYLATWQGHGKPGNGYDEGLQLKEGLNILPIYGDMLTGCVNYVVQTFNSAAGYGNKSTVRKLSDYDNIKIHVEGGYVNGFFNLMGDELWGEGDDNADWDYYAARASHIDFTMLGKYMTLQFPLEDKDCVDEGGGINKGMKTLLTGKNIAKQSLQEWDNVMLQERMLMGVASKADVDAANAKWKSPYSGKDEVISHTGGLTDGLACNYDDYYNVHGLAFGVPTGYMYGSWDHSGYNYNTMESVIVTMITDAGSHWGPGHEIGHQHQQPFTLNGLTEVTNNLFSNVVVWYFGKSTSRVNGDQGNLENVAMAFNTPGGDFYTNNIWALTHMYYRLFMYYHLLGHNTAFYPRLYELMRQEPMQRGYEQSGKYGMLHFYKQACIAAGEDLTEFFRAHGVLTPMTDRMVGDYSNSNYNSPQADIDAAIETVKKMNLKENLAPLFINDGTGQKMLGSTGQELSLFDGFTTSEVGNYAYFYEPAGAHTYTVSEGFVTLEGTGGIGYLVRNADGEIMAFANKKKMQISDEVALMLMKGEAKVEVINGDNTFVEAAGNKIAAQRVLLESLLEEATTMLKYFDDTNKKVGYYREAYKGNLPELTEIAQAVFDESKEEEYASAYENLFAVVDAIKTNPAAMVGIINGSEYQLTTYKKKTTAMVATTGTKVVKAENISSTKTAQRWIFEEAGGDNLYYIKNKATKTYIDELESGKQATVQGTTPTVAFKVINLGNGVLAVQCQEGKSQSLNHNSGSVLGWSYEGDENSWWYITAKALNEEELNKIELSTLITKTNDLLEEMGEDVVLPGSLPLQTETKAADFYLSTNADQNVVGTANDGGGIAALLDGNTSTYLHTQWNGSAVSGDHYVQVYLGEELELPEFTFTYATRKAGSASTTSPAPSNIKVTASKDGKNFSKVLGTFTTSGTNPLPAYSKLGQYWTSKVLSLPADYHYIRFTVTASSGPASNTYGGHAFFAMSEFSIDNPTTVVNSLTDEFKNLDEEKYEWFKAAYKEAANQMFVAMTISKNENSTAEEIATALAELQAKYDALLAGYNDPTDISGVVVNTMKQKGIYDLSGRRLNTITAPGLYIIDGQKRFVK